MLKRMILFFCGLTILSGILTAQLSVAISDSANLSCFGSGDGTAAATIQGGTAPYEILWDDDSASTDATVTDLEAKRWYKVTVTDAAMAIAKDSVMLSEPDEILYELVGLKTIQCYGPAEGYLVIRSSGGTGPHTYGWTGEITSDRDSIFNLSAGKYFYTVTDSTGCSIHDSLTLTEADRVNISIDSVKPNPCLGLQSGEIHTSAGGGQLPYQYQWTGPSGFSSTQQDITGLPEGMYKLKLTDARGCAYEKDTSLIDGDPISVSYTVSAFETYNLICYGDASGSISVDTVAGNGRDWRAYTYIWSGPSAFKAYTPEISALKAGNYYLNVFDSVNCRSNLTIELLQPPAITVHYDSIITNPCLDDQNSSIYISATNGNEPLSYSWTGPDGFSSTDQDLTGLGKGQYSVTVTDGKNCMSASGTTLEQVDNINMNLSVSEFGDFNISCYGLADGFIKVTGIPGYTDLSGFTFLTTGPDGFSSPFRFITAGVKAGEYLVTATDPLGCKGEKSTTLTQPDAVRTGTIDGAVKFEHDSNYVYDVSDPSGTSTYTWSVEGGEIWSGQGSGTVEIEWRSTGSGKVKLIETDQDGCRGDTVYLGTSFHDLTGLTSNAAAGLKIYPNPVQSVLHIEGSGSFKGKAEFFNMLGRMVLQKELSPRLNVESLENGIYYLKITAVDGKTVLTRQIIKR